VSDPPVNLDKHRGLSAQKATDIRRAIAEVEANATLLRERQIAVETDLLSVSATTWPEAVAKARYVLNLYAASLAPADTHHRDLVASVLADLTRLCAETSTT
jgi:ribosomal protein L10